jgi:hypothetical protein
MPVNFFLTIPVISPCDHHHSTPSPDLKVFLLIRPDRTPLRGALTLLLTPFLDSAFSARSGTHFARVTRQKRRVRGCASAHGRERTRDGRHRRDGPPRSLRQETRLVPQLRSGSPFYFAGIDETSNFAQSMHSVFRKSKVAGDALVQEHGRYFSMPTAVFRGSALSGPNHSVTKLPGSLAYLTRWSLLAIDTRCPCREEFAAPDPRAGSRFGGIRQGNADG